MKKGKSENKGFMGKQRQAGSTHDPKKASGTRENNPSVAAEEEVEEVVVAKLQAQSGFGELALITNKPRAATVRADGVTLLMVFLREEYQNIIGGGLSKALEEKMSFFKEVSIFKQVESKMQPSHLQNLVYFFQPKNFNKGEVV